MDTVSNAKNAALLRFLINRIQEIQQVAEREARGCVAEIELLSSKALATVEEVQAERDRRRLGV
jgi:hypothetical protein